MKFSEMPYARPNADELKAQLQQFTKELQQAENYEAANAAFLKREQWSRQVSTLSTLVQIRHSIDTRDKFYDAEMKFWNELGPELQEYEQAWTGAMLQSPVRAQFEKEDGGASK